MMSANVKADIKQQEIKGPVSSRGIWGSGGGGSGQKPSNKQPKFLNFLILVPLRNYFIEVLNKFLMCFKINGLKNLHLI